MCITGDMDMRSEEGLEGNGVYIEKIWRERELTNGKMRVHVLLFFLYGLNS